MQAPTSTCKKTEARALIHKRSHIKTEMERKQKTQRSKRLQLIPKAQWLNMGKAKNAMSYANFHSYQTSKS
jgi:hypothetical protein